MRNILFGTILLLLMAVIASAHDTATGHMDVGLQPVVTHFWDGTNFFDARDISAADGAASADGIQACGMVGYDGSNYQSVLTDSSGNVLVKIVAGSSSIGVTSAEITKMGTAGTVNTDNTSQSSDFDLVTAATNLRLLGLTIRESAGTAAAATVIIRHGNISGGNCSGNVIGFFELNGDQSIQIPDYAGGRGLSVASGICADVITGTVDANAFTVIEANP